MINYIKRVSKVTNFAIKSKAMPLGSFNPSIFKSWATPISLLSLGIVALFMLLSPIIQL